MSLFWIRVSRWLLISIALILPVACISVATFIVQQYDGSPLPRERVSILRLNANEPAIIVALDGEKLDFAVTERDVRVHIEMLPGQHSLDIGYVNDPIGVQRVNIWSEPGKVYRVVLTAGANATTTTVSTEQANWQASLFFVDRDNDTLVAEAPQRAPGTQTNVLAKPVDSPSAPTSPTASAQHNSALPPVTTSSVPATAPPVPSSSSSAPAATTSSIPQPSPASQPLPPQATTPLTMAAPTAIQPSATPSSRRGPSQAPPAASTPPAPPAASTPPAPPAASTPPAPPAPTPDK